MRDAHGAGARLLHLPEGPHLSLYVISDRGAIATRYDERMLSNTKVSHMYTPGSTPVTCTVDGVRFGFALGMEAPSGVITPDGDWLTRCPRDPVSAITIADLDLTADNRARPWRRVARSGLYAQYQAPNDPRSLDRAHY